jgi:hypothetical protein
MYEFILATQLGLTRDKLVQLNNTMRLASDDDQVDETDAPTASPTEQESAQSVLKYNGGVLPLELRIAPMSVARWQFNAQMEVAIGQQKHMGASEKDMDDMRLMLTETPPLLLAITIVVSLFHILFDILAFKNDVQFWKVSIVVT